MFDYLKSCNIFKPGSKVKKNWLKIVVTEVTELTLPSYASVTCKSVKKWFLSANRITMCCQI